MCVVNRMSAPNSNAKPSLWSRLTSINLFGRNTSSTVATPSMLNRLKSMNPFTRKNNASGNVAKPSVGGRRRRNRKTRRSRK